MPKVRVASLWPVTRTNGLCGIKQLGCPPKHPLSGVLCERSGKIVKDFETGKRKKELEKITLCLIWCYLLANLAFHCLWAILQCYKLLKTDDNANDALSTQMQVNCFLGKATDCCLVDRPFGHLFVNSFQYVVLQIYLWTRCNILLVPSLLNELKSLKRVHFMFYENHDFTIFF